MKASSQNYLRQMKEESSTVPTMMAQYGLYPFPSYILLAYFSDLSIDSPPALKPPKKYSDISGHLVSYRLLL